MLGNVPCVPCTASSRSLLIPCEDSDVDTVGRSNTVQVTVSRPPCKVIIGFDVEAEKKQLSHICESPRSVLELPAALSPHGKQQAVARYPRSGLGSLLAPKTGSDEDVTVGNDSISRCPAAKKVSPATVCELCTESTFGGHSINSSLHTAMCQCDFSGDVCAQGLHLASQGDLKDELLAVDICPLRVAGSGSLLKNEQAEIGLSTSPASQTCKFPLGTALKVDKEAATECKQGKGSPNIKSSASARDKMFSRESINNEVVVPDRTFIMSSNVVTSPEHTCLHSVVGVRYKSPPSIFVTSPPNRPGHLARTTSGFLKSCNFCGCFLNLEKDIFMYRGDQTFCSAECRYRKIALEESKDRRAAKH